MIKFRCSACSKKIGVPVEYATKRVRCPRCKDVIVIPAPELELEPVGALEPAAVVEPPLSHEVMAETEDPPESESDDLDELEPLSSDETIWTDEMLASSVSAMAASQDEDIVHCANCGVIVVDGETCQMCGHPVREVQSEPSSLDSDDQQAPQKTSFIKDLGRFLTPIRDFSDGVAFVMILLLSMFVSYPITFPFVVMAKIMASGIVCSFMINVMLETANGNEHLPSPANLPETWWKIVRPYYQLLISAVYAFLPGIIVFLLYYTIKTTSGAEEINPVGQKVILVAMLSCLFFWPMIILVIALRDSFFIRPDKLVVSIIRTFKPYIICCVCLYAAVAVTFLSVAMYASKGQGGLIVAAITAQVGGLSIQIYAMRVMGLLYRYYGDRLDW